MKKKVIIFSICITLVCIATIIYVFASRESDSEKEPTVIYLNELTASFNPGILWLGPVPETFEKHTNILMIYSINENALNDITEYGYRAIVVNDLDSTCSLSDEELLLVKEYVENKGYDFYYLGEKELSRFVLLGFSVGFESGEMSLEYIGSDKIGVSVQQNEMGNLYAEHGLMSDQRLVNGADKNTVAMESLAYYLGYHANAAAIAEKDRGGQ